MITAQLVKQLRDQTQAGMLDCKKALEASGGDIQEAINVLRRQGIASGETRLGHQATEGTITIVGNTIVQLNCETDFVARNEDFISLSVDIAEGRATEEEIKLASATFGENIVLKDKQILHYQSVGGYVHSNYKIGVLVGIDSPGESELASELAMHIAAAKPQYVSREDVPQDLVDAEKAFLLIQPDLASKPASIQERMIEGRLKKFYTGLCLLEQQWIKDPTLKITDLLKGVTVGTFVRLEV